MSVRIIAGSRRGAVLATPEGLDTRPLRDRVRESLFNILRERTAGARVLDAFAGSGAVGLEAVSRGAAHATFIDPSDAAVATIRRNITKLRFEAACEVMQGRSPDCYGRLQRPPGGVSLVFLMPPYHSGLCDVVLASSALATLLATGTDDALAVCEVHRDEPIPAPAGWAPVDERCYGITRLVMLGWRGATGA